MKYDNELSGALFPKDKKDVRHAKSPTHNGTVTVHGVEYWVSGWRKKSKAGKDYMSLALTPKDENEHKRVAALIDDDDPLVSNPVPDGDEFDAEDIPF